MKVWCNLFKAFCKEEVEKNKKKYSSDFDMPYGDENFKAIWALHDNPDVPRAYRIVLMSTFDNVILEKEHFEDFEKAVYEYARRFACGQLLDQARVISGLKKRKIIGVCWNQTSVNADAWYVNGHRANVLKDGVGWYMFKDF